MKITDHIAQHITEAFTSGNWSDVSFTDTLADVSLEEATTRTNASANTIASLVYHINFYNEIILERLKGNKPFINEASGFDMPPLQTNEDWQQLKENCLLSANTLAEAVRQFPEEKLFEIAFPGNFSSYKTFHGIAEHTHYHLGQIVLLKNLIRQIK